MLFGWGLYCIGPGEIVFRFQNVLAQLSVAYILAFLVIRKSVAIQIGFSVLLILISEGLYRYFPVEGFTNAFVAGENFGAWFNILISGSEDGGHWAMLMQSQLLHIQSGVFWQASCLWVIFPPRKN